MSRGTSNCVKTLTLLFTKVHLELYQSQTEVCLQCARLSGDYLSQKKKKEERGENSYTVAVKISSCLNFFFTSVYM